MTPSVDKTPVGWLALGSLGVVFGDIGTSPIYTFKQCVSDHPDSAHIYGAVSLIIWYLLAIVSLKYVHYLMRLSNQGEGGVFALLALVKANASHQKWLIYVLIGGAALLYGDGIITPAISVLSAVEGLAPPTLANNAINPAAWANSWIAAIILAVLFFFQKYGTNAISKACGPVMLGWFLVLAALAVGPIFVVGLAKDKRAILVLASGGVFSDGPWKPFDFVEPYLRTILGFIGIEDIQTIRVEGTNIPALVANAVPNAERAAEALKL